MRNPIDIVTENPDLTFPPDVQYHFVFWQHIDENIPDIVPELRDADVIAAESAGNHTYDAEFIRNSLRIYPLLSTYIRGDDPEDAAFVEKHIHENPAFARQLSVQLSTALRGAKTELVPVDSLTVPSNELDPRITAYDAARDIAPLSDKMHDFVVGRESLVLRQLSELGHKTVQTNPNAKIAVLYGSRHEFLAIAARQLGAQVTKKLVHGRTYLSVTEEVATRQLRFGKYPSYADMPERDKQLLDVTDSLYMLTGRDVPKNVIFAIKKLADMRERDPAAYDTLSQQLWQGTSLAVQASEARGLGRALKAKQLNKILKTLESYRLV